MNDGCQLTLSRGSYRHTSSQDKSDQKKVVTASFYRSDGEKIATSHAHGDGTWSIAFTPLGEEELGKQHSSGSTIGDGQLGVVVRSEVVSGRLFHHGEMKCKPQACRGYISLNSDAVHRARHPQSVDDGVEAEVTEETRDGDGRRPDGTSLACQSTNRQPSAPILAQYQRGRSRLTEEQEQLALGLATPHLSRKEERSLFQQLKEMSWEEQEQVLKHSNLLKSRG